MKEKLKEIGDRLDVSKDEVSEIKKEKLKANIFYLVMASATAVLTFMLGYEYYLVSSGSAGYPYALSAPLMTKVKSSKGEVNPVIATVLLTLFTITLAGYLYMNLPKAYGVYYKEKIETSSLRRLIR